MKNLIISIFFILLFPCLSFAHSGSLDENGGHYDRSTGEYHYHHGFPAHQHINGECPYDFEDNANRNSSSSSSVSYKYIKEEDKTSPIDIRLLPLSFSLSIILYILLENYKFHNLFGEVLSYIYLANILFSAAIISSQFTYDLLLIFIIISFIVTLYCSVKINCLSQNHNKIILTMLASSFIFWILFF